MFQRQLKMALKIGNVFINEDDLIPVIVKANTNMEELETDMEPDNVMDKYAILC